MPVITLTTDLGTRDYYAGAVKGELLKLIPTAQIIDITHDVEVYNIFNAAFVLKNCYRSFPTGTIHLIGVDTQSDPDRNYLVIYFDDHYFIGSDNGMFSLLFEENNPLTYKIKITPEEKYNTFPLKNIFTRIAALISQGELLESFAEPVPSYKQTTGWRPIIQDNFIRGMVIYMDRFENAVINITREEFLKARRDRNFIFSFKKNNDINEISRNYFDVPEGDIVCLFNSNGYMELAMNRGNFGSLMNVNTREIVQIDFK